MHENLTKNRLMKAEPQWVTAWQEKLKAQNSLGKRHIHKHKFQTKDLNFLQPKIIFVIWLAL